MTKIDVIYGYYKRLPTGVKQKIIAKCNLDPLVVFNMDKNSEVYELINNNLELLKFLWIEYISKKLPKGHKNMGASEFLEIYKSIANIYNQDTTKINNDCITSFESFEILKHNITQIVYLGSCVFNQQKISMDDAFKMTYFNMKTNIRTMHNIFISACKHKQYYDFIKLMLDKRIYLNNNYNHFNYNNFNNFNKTNDITSEVDDEKIPLIVAVRYNNYDVVKLLIDYGYNIYVKNNLGQTPLIVSIIYKNYIITNLLLDHLNKNDNDNKNKKDYINMKDNNGMTALMEALMEASNNYDINIVKLLIENGADVNTQNILGNTALIMSCKTRYDNCGIIELLLNNGADIMIQNKNDETALMVASNLEKLKLLLNYYCEINKLVDNNGKNSIREQQFMKEYFINLQNIQGKNALMLNSDDNYDAVKLLLNNGANIYLQDIYGNTALTNAIKCCQEDIIRLLFDAEIYTFKNNLKNNNLKNIESICFIKNVKGNTALTFACKYSEDISIKMIINHIRFIYKNDKNDINHIIKSYVNICNDKHKTGLMYACGYNYINKVILLLENRAETNIKSKSGDTALIKAASKGNLSIVKLLLQNGANKNIKNKQGLTASSIAKTNFHHDISMFLDNLP